MLLRQEFASSAGISPPAAASFIGLLLTRGSFMLTHEDISEILEYHPEVGGSCLVWKKRQAKNTIVGARAGRRHYSGYWEIRAYYKLHKAHRLVWLLNTKEWPKCNIDHIDGDPSNNRIENLRQCTQSENNQNQIAQRSHRRLPIGVSTRGGKFRARIMLHGKERQLGMFKTPEEAHAAYLKAKARLHTFNPTQRA